VKARLEIFIEREIGSEDETRLRELFSLGFHDSICEFFNVGYADNEDFEVRIVNEDRQMVENLY
jgi:hypothetical protein